MHVHLSGTLPALCMCRSTDCWQAWRPSGRAPIGRNTCMRPAATRCGRPSGATPAQQQPVEPAAPPAGRPGPPGRSGHVGRRRARRACRARCGQAACCRPAGCTRWKRQYRASALLRTSGACGLEGHGHYHTGLIGGVGGPRALPQPPAARSTEGAASHCAPCWRLMQVVRPWNRWCLMRGYGGVARLTRTSTRQHTLGCSIEQPVATATAVLLC